LFFVGRELKKYNRNARSLQHGNSVQQIPPDAIAKGELEAPANVQPSVVHYISELASAESGYPRNYPA
jgi:hypothetical protein